VVSFAREGRIAAEAGCNSMSGALDVGPDRLVVGELAMTRMSCGPALDAQDAWLSGVLEGDPAYTVSGARLRLEAGGTVIELVERDSGQPDRAGR
jgi:heat shock protein HslJ